MSGWQMDIKVEEQTEKESKRFHPYPPERAEKGTACPE